MNLNHTIDYLSKLELTAALLWFIENANEEYPHRTGLLIYLQARAQKELRRSACKATNPSESDELLLRYQDLKAAAKRLQKLTRPRQASPRGLGGVSRRVWAYLKKLYNLRLLP